MSRLKTSSIALLLVSAALLLACEGDPEAPPDVSSESSPTPRHLIFISVDTLRADHLSLYGYPRETSPVLEKWAEDGVVFERAIAQWPKTGPSFASMFTGQYPQTTGLTHKAAIRIPDAYLTLPELLHQNGFTNVAVVSNAVLADHLGWNRGFDAYRETWKEAPEESEDPEEYRKWINARLVNQLALPLLDEHQDAERLFAWIHYSDPHAPYLLPEDVPNPFLDDPYYTGDETVTLHNPHARALGDRRDLKYYVAQYDANVRFVDEHLGALLEHLDELEILEDALVVFTSDHGESLGEHDYFFGHGRLPHQPGVHVPLVVSYPKAIPGGRRVAAPVELVDLYPTLREWLLPDLPDPGLEGDSLAPFLRPDSNPASPGTAHLAFSQAGGGSPLTHFRSVQDERHKLVYHPPMKRKGRETPARIDFYRLDEDPGETRNLAEDGDTPEEMRRLHRELRAWMKGDDWIRRPESEIQAQSEETLRALRALGYIE